MRSPLLLPSLVRWLAWAGCALAISIVLLVPMPPEATSAGPLGSSYSFTANFVHVLAYGTWSVLTGLLPLARIRRASLLLLLLAHAGATELLQGLVPTRYPDWQDVGWDILGLVLGVIVSWGWWRRP